ncbi:hypothetical protein GBAR_LOCUS17176 [Geodia barretti]|uniref:FLYWCH-type domain-containing protein n=1 Tax=Geodia barretti TaxID=519541 RepID=A0AA35WVD8_GEOBA|nr:hypothetical protein GBAR_LOCUS17176 [Geodia barretti]
MSFASETTTDQGSLSDVVHEGTSSRASATSSSGASCQQDGDLGGDGSESESYVEVEQLGDDGGSAPPGFPSLTTPTVLTSPAPSPPCNGNVVRHVTKRTLITLHQRSVLEEYYRNGMTSASQQLAEVHELVAAKTGLDITVVRRRRVIMESVDREHQQPMEVKPHQQPVEIKEDPTEVRYVLTQKGGQALLYGGHCFYKVRDGENRKTFWRCSKYRTESCEVRVTTLEDQVVGIRGQHKHPAENNSDRIRASSETQLNWIRNRRRPNAAKMAEKLAEKIAPYTIAATSSLPSQLPTLIHSNPTSLPTLTTFPHPMVVTTTNHHHNLATPGLIRVTDTAPHIPVIPFGSHLTGPEAKRICLDHNIHHSKLSLFSL